MDNSTLDANTPPPNVPPAHTDSDTPRSTPSRDSGTIDPVDLAEVQDLVDLESTVDQLASDVDTNNGRPESPSGSFPYITITRKSRKGLSLTATPLLPPLRVHHETVK